MRALNPVTLTGAIQEIQITAKPVTPTPTPIRFANESPYALQIQMAGKTFWLQPWTVDVFTPDLHVITMTVRPTILTPLLAPAPSYQLLITLADAGESFGGQYPFNLDRQTAGYSQQVLLDTITIVSDGQSITHSGIQIPPGTHGIGIVTNIPTVTSGNILSWQVVGNVSGSFYLNLSTVPAQMLVPLYAPFLSGVDTAVNFTVNATNPATNKPFNVYLVALLDPLVVSSVLQAGSQTQIVDRFGNTTESDVDILGNANSRMGVSLETATPAAWQAATNLPPVTRFRVTPALLAETTVIAGVAGKHLWLLGGMINTNSTATWEVTFWDGPVANGFPVADIFTALYTAVGVTPSTPINWHGVKLGLGNGLVMRLDTASAGATVIGHVIAGLR